MTVTQLPRGADQLLEHHPARQSIRTETDITATIAPIGHDGVAGRPTTGELLDLSASGARLRTSEPILLGQALVITFSLPDHPGPIAVTGEIVNAEPHAAGTMAVGIRFLGLQEPVRIALTRFVLRNNKARGVGAGRVLDQQRRPA